MNKLSTALCTLLITSGSIVLSGCIPAIIAGGAGAAVGASAVGSGLSLQTQMDDQAIKSKAYNILNHMKALNYHSNIEVVVFNHQLLLLGQVPSTEVRKEIAEKMSHINKVSIVYNHLTIGPATGVSQYSHDTWISTKVKSNFIGKVNPFHFEVTTENGVVYIMGITTQAEGEKAAEIASQTTGVKRVVKVFTYIKPKAENDSKANKEKQQDQAESSDYYNQTDLTHTEV